MTLTKSEVNKLKKIYYSVGGPGNFTGSAQVLRRLAKPTIPNLTLKSTREFLQQQYVYSRTKRPHTRRQFAHYVCTGANQLFFADLMFQKTHVYLVCVDNFTSKIMCVKCSSKKPSVVANAFDRLIEQQNDGEYCDRLIVDKGKEWSQAFVDRVSQHGVRVFHSTSLYKACGAERAINSLRRLYVKYCLYEGRNVPFDTALPVLLTVYNNTPTKTGFAPAAVSTSDCGTIFAKKYPYQLEDSSSRTDDEGHIPLHAYVRLLTTPTAKGHTFEKVTALLSVSSSLSLLLLLYADTNIVS